MSGRGWVEGGIELRNRSWAGYQIVNKKPMFMLPPAVRIPEEAAWGLLLYDVRRKDEAWA